MSNFPSPLPPPSGTSSFLSIPVIGGLWNSSPCWHAHSCAACPRGRSHDRLSAGQPRYAVSQPGEAIGLDETGQLLWEFVWRIILGLFTDEKDSGRPPRRPAPRPRAPPSTSHSRPPLRPSQPLDLRRGITISMARKLLR